MVLSVPVFLLEDSIYDAIFPDSLGVHQAACADYSSRLNESVSMREVGAVGGFPNRDCDGLSSWRLFLVGCRAALVDRYSDQLARLNAFPIATLVEYSSQFPFRYAYNRDRALRHG